MLLWIIIFVVGASAIFVARRQRNLAVANFSPSNARTTTGRVIPEIARVWPSGPIVPVYLEPEGSFVPCHSACVRALVTNLKVGHAFPTGPLDVIEVWLEFQATDGRGQAVYSAGTLGPDGSIQGRTVEYRSYLLDKNAQPVFTHALWNVVGARDKRVIMPGGSDTTEFSFPIPRNAAGPLQCEVRLLCRKFNSQTQAQLFPAGNGPKIPVIEISKATIQIPLAAQKRRAASVGVAHETKSLR